MNPTLRSWVSSSILIAPRAFCICALVLKVCIHVEHSTACVVHTVKMALASLLNERSMNANLFPAISFPICPGRVLFWT